MRLTEYARKLGVTYRTAWSWFKDGKIEGAYKTPSGSIIIIDENKAKEECGVVLYARTSSSQNKKLLDDQSKRLEAYAIAKGYKIRKVVKEFGSGLNDGRKQLEYILKENKFDKIIIEHKDRLTRFGFNWFQVLTNNRIEVIYDSKERDEDLVQDLISIIHSFSARLYGQRKAKRLNYDITKTIRDGIN